MFLIDTIKPKIKKNKNFFFARLFKGGDSEAYKIKPVLFLLALGLLAATKTLFKRNERYIL